ncbi:MAG: Ig-like domain-containing protein [Candidatus Eisenbacteria bacterium]
MSTSRIRLFLILLACSATFACNDRTTDSVPDDAPDPEGGWIVAAPDVATVLPGDSFGIEATAFTADGNPAPEASLMWSSSNTSIAAVDARGRVEALSPGNVEIVASWGRARARVQVAVYQAAVLEVPDGVEFRPESLHISSPSSEWAVDEDGRFGFDASENGHALIALNQHGNPVLIGQAAGDGSVDFTLDATAVALVLLDPRLVGAPTSPDWGPM